MLKIKNIPLIIFNYTYNDDVYYLYNENNFRKNHKICLYIDGFIIKNCFFNIDKVFKNKVICSFYVPDSTPLITNIYNRNTFPPSPSFSERLIKQINFLLSKNDKIYKFVCLYDRFSSTKITNDIENRIFFAETYDDLIYSRVCFKINRIKRT